VATGRPTKLTPKVQQAICDAVRNGNYYEAAATSAGIEYRTFRNWVERGEQEDAGIYFQFVQSLRAAEAEAETKLVAEWRAQVPEDWRAARDLLARRHPERWGPKDRLTLAGDRDAPLAVTIEALALAHRELQEYERQRRAVGTNGTASPPAGS
jgi:hypothetical protein